MATLEFPAYGNIYFADAPIEDASLKIPLEDGFWKTLSGYASGLVDAAFSRLPNEQVAANDCPFRGSLDDHKRLIKICQETMQRLTEDDRIQKAALPALILADYNKRNIYVSPDDPSVITGIIDWQLSCIEPAFIYAQGTPDFAALPDIDPSEEDDTSKPKSRQEELLLKDLSICHQTYDVIATHKSRKLGPGRLLDPTLFRLFHYCFTTWRDGAPAIRQELIDLRALWSKLSLPGPECPYSPTGQELKEHARQFEDFETMQKLKAWLKISMQTTSDGWIPNEIWDAAREANTAAYEEWMQTARESEQEGGDMTVERAEALAF